ncbi:hypothetical protein [Chloroflexus aggregans]|nr:hypothetical protein [Chloroflexus aggregans]
MRDLYHLEMLSAEMINERLTTAANDRLLPRSTLFAGWHAGSTFC